MTATFELARTQDWTNIDCCCNINRVFRRQKFWQIVDQQKKESELITKGIFEINPFEANTEHM